MSSNASSSRPPLVELKNGKVIFKQKPVQLDKMSETLQEIVKFRAMLSQASEPILCIPREHHSLIGKLAHESDKTFNVLSKAIRSQLLPEPLEVDSSDAQSTQNIGTALPQTTVDAALQSVAERVNYGVDQGQCGLTKLPSSLCIWRWEVKDVSILPAQFRDKAESRKQERSAAREELKKLLIPLSLEERAKVLGLKLLVSVDGSNITTSVLTPQMNADSSSEVPDNKGGGEGSSIGTSQAKQEPLKVSVKVQKQIQEEASTKKSAAVFAKFFTKKQARKADNSLASSSRGGTEETSLTNDYDRHFHPFLLKRNMTLAPKNWFAKRKKDMIIIDSDDCQVATLSPDGLNAPAIHLEPNLTELIDLLALNIRALPPGLSDSRFPKKITNTNPLTVRTLMDQLVDAEVCGDEMRVLDLMKRLGDRRRIPAKTLSFADDVRPGYVGTWTRSSLTIGPRTPFAKDAAALDYNYDSGEEWEEEEEEEGEEVASGNDSDGDVSDSDSLDDWLIDDDEDVGGEPINLDGIDLTGYELPERKRKTSPNLEQGSGKEKRRKLVQPLIPFIKGPCWESPIGQSDWDGFVPYRIQVFNNLNGPLNPFAYVAEFATKPVEYRSHSNGQHVTSLPTAQTPNITKTGGTEIMVQWKVPTQAASVRSSVFPEEHVKALLHGIQNCKTSSLNVLVDTLYQELKKEKVKKNSIERKVREIAEKRLDSDAGIKVWTVKMEYLQPGIAII